MYHHKLTVQRVIAGYDFDVSSHYELTVERVIARIKCHSLTELTLFYANIS